jgi:hypothetical protein
MKSNPFSLAAEEEVAARRDARLHRYGPHGALCATENKAVERNSWRKDSGLADRLRAVTSDPRAEIVVDTSGGFVPLWAEHSVLRWRFDETSLQAFADPEAAKAGMRRLFEAAVADWGFCPATFVEDDRLYDFQIVMRRQKRCSPNGCVLASAFFPDGGQHELVIYPSMFEQDEREQRETLVHEIGHIFGLRHFFANIKETAMSSTTFGEHSRFSIMNYGSDSKLTDADRADLERLYRAVWSRELSAINGTQVRLMRPFTSRAL